MNFQFACEKPNAFFVGGIPSDHHLTVKHMPNPRSLSGFLVGLHSDLVITDGEPIGMPTGNPRYSFPLKDPSLFLKFVATNNDFEKIRGFFLEYGFLGGGLCNLGNVHLTGFDASIAANVERLDQWREEAQAMGELVEVWRALQGGAFTKLESWFERTDEIFRFRGRQIAEFNSGWEQYENAGLSWDERLGVASAFLAFELQKRLEGGQTQIPYFRPDQNGFAWTLRPNSLRAALWLQFGQAVVGQAKLNQCDGCGRSFLTGEVGQRRKKRTDAVTCSETCRKRANRKKAKLENPVTNL